MFKLACPAPALFHLPFETQGINGRDGRSPTGRRTYGQDDIAVQLMFYSTFEMLDRPGSGPMETLRVVKLYEPSPLPIHYAGLVSNSLGQVLLMPSFLHWNSTTTIQHGFSNLQLRHSNSHTAVLTLPRSQTGREAASSTLYTRSTNG